MVGGVGKKEGKQSVQFFFGGGCGGVRHLWGEAPVYDRCYLMKVGTDLQIVLHRIMLSLSMQIMTCHGLTNIQYDVIYPRGQFKMPLFSLLLRWSKDSLFVCVFFFAFFFLAL